MNAKLSLIRAADSWGDRDCRTHQRTSEVTAEEMGGMLRLTVKQGALDSYDAETSRPEAVAAISLRREHVRTLAAFLASLPDEDA